MLEFIHRLSSDLEVALAVSHSLSQLYVRVPFSPATPLHTPTWARPQPDTHTRHTSHWAHTHSPAHTLLARSMRQRSILSRGLPLTATSLRFVSDLQDVQVLFIRGRRPSGELFADYQLIADTANQMDVECKYATLLVQSLELSSIKSLQMSEKIHLCNMYK